MEAREEAAKGSRSTGEGARVWSGPHDPPPAPFLIQQPDPEQVLWRYTSFAKFIALCTSNSLWFSRLDLLGDPFEGSYSRYNVAERPAVYAEMPPHVVESLIRTYRGVPKWTLASCWHASDHESDGMWRIYAPNGEGVAIRTSVDHLTASLSPRKVTTGRVSYVDYESTWIPEGNLLYPAFHKRKAFEHEREVRAVILRTPPDSAGGGVDFGAEPDCLGESIPVNLSRLVKEVRVAPNAPPWFFDVVAATAESLLRLQPAQSVLSDAPVW